MPAEGRFCTVLPPITLLSDCPIPIGGFCFLVGRESILDLAPGAPREQVLSEMRGNQQQAQEQNPKSYLAGQVAGGVAQAQGDAFFTAADLL